MYKFTRLFLLWSLVAVSMTTVAAVVYRQHEEARYVELLETQNINLAQAFANSIFPAFSAAVTSATKSDGITALPTPRKSHAIEKSVIQLMKGLPIEKVEIYDMEGRAVYSTDGSETGKARGLNSSLFDAAQNGYPVSKLVDRGTNGSAAGSGRNRDLVESYVPIRRGDSQVKGVIVLYTDVGAATPEFAGSAVSIVAGIAMVLGLLGGFWLLIVRTADRTVRQQHAAIAEKSDALEHEIGMRKQIEEANEALERQAEQQERELAEVSAEHRLAAGESQSLRNALARVGQINMFGEMAASLAHELYQPLTVISGYAQFCARQLRSAKEQSRSLRNAIEQIADQAERASKILRSIRGIIGREQPDRRTIDVNEVIRHVADLVQLEVDDHGIELILDLCEPIPTVVADPMQIEQVALNLVHNAIEAIERQRPDSPNLTIQTRAPDKDSIVVNVRDEGCGIPEADLEQIFEPLFTTRADGLGIGLYLSQSMIKAHGGRMWATSNGETGAELHFTLPVARL